MRRSSGMSRSKGDLIFDAMNHIFIVLVLVICFYPLYYTVIASISEPNDVLSGKVFFWPRGFTIDTYLSVINYKLIWTGYYNTILYTVLGTAYNLFLLLPASYAMAKRGLKGKGALMGVFVFTMYFGGGMIPSYINMKNLGLVNSMWAMIIPGAFSVYNMIITRTYFASSFPESLAEAAKIDGAGEFGIFFRIALPLSSAIVAVMALYHAIGHWNSYFNALIYLNDTKDYPLQLVLRQVLLQNSGITVDTSQMSTEEVADAIRKAKLAETMKYAVIFIANAPVLAAYPFVQKYFVKGIMIGSIKG